MRARAPHAAFGTCHAIVPATYFAGTVALCVLSPQPVLAAIWLAGALCFSLASRGPRATLRGLRWQLPMLALVCLVNPLVSASGSTLLLRVGPVVVYGESLAYGACMGCVMVAGVLWFEGAAQVLTQDRLLALAGRRARSVPMVLGLATQLVPQMLSRARTVRAAREACTAAPRDASPASALVRDASLLLSWALDDSVGRADAMRARGWESGCERTRLEPDPLRPRDVACASAFVALLAVCAAASWAACSQWRFYPSMPRLTWWWGYVPCAVLSLLPTVLAALGELGERGPR